MLPMHILYARLPSDGTTEAPTQNVGANARCTRIGKLIVEIRGSSIVMIVGMLSIVVICFHLLYLCS